MACDLAETYHILDMQAVPVRTLARLVFGLEDSSRTVRKLSGSTLTMEQVLMAQILDYVAFIAWTHTEDSRKGRHRPSSVLAKLLGMEKDQKADRFATPEDFMRARAKLLHEVQNNG